MVSEKLFGFPEEEAKKIFEELKKFKEGVIKTVKRRIKKENPPPLHSLTSLQREANRLYGYSAKRVLDLAQSLYEKWKVISYPRTESRYLAEANRPLVVQILKKLGREDLVPEVGKVGKRVFDDSKLTDHHAIIPLEPPPEGLSKEEKRIYDLILRRFLAVFYPPYRYELVEILTEVGGKYLFYSRLRRTLDPGWRILYGLKEEKVEIPDLKEGETVKKVSQKLVKETTKPPPRFTEGTLLKEMERLGLGTPATRAQIIETLKGRGYITKKGKSLVPTQKGKELIEKLEGSPLTSPELTSDWERKLEEINLKRLGYEGYKNFLERVKEFTKTEIEKLKEKTFLLKEPINVGRPRRVVKRRRKKP